MEIQTETNTINSFSVNEIKPGKVSKTKYSSDVEIHWRLEEWCTNFKETQSTQIDVENYHTSLEWIIFKIRKQDWISDTDVLIKVNYGYDEKEKHFLDALFYDYSHKMYFFYCLQTEEKYMTGTFAEINEKDIPDAMMVSPLTKSCIHQYYDNVPNMDDMSYNSIKFEKLKHDTKCMISVKGFDGNNHEYSGIGMDTRGAFVRAYVNMKRFMSNYREDVDIYEWR